MHLGFLSDQLYLIYAPWHSQYVSILYDNCAAHTSKETIKLDTHVFGMWGCAPEFSFCLTIYTRFMPIDSLTK